MSGVQMVILPGLLVGIDESEYILKYVFGEVRALAIALAVLSKYSLKYSTYFRAVL